MPGWLLVCLRASRHHVPVPRGCGGRTIARPASDRRRAQRRHRRRVARRDLTAAARNPTAPVRLYRGCHARAVPALSRRPRLAPLPGARGGDPGVVGSGPHLRSLGRAPAGRGERRVRLLRRPAVRQRAPPLRPPAHRLRQGRRPPLPDHAGPPGRAPLRLGLPRPAGRDRGREAARRVRPGPDHRVRHRAVQRLLPTLGPALHPGMGALRHPPGPLGRLRPTTTRPWTSPTWRASCGPSSSSTTRACSTRPTGCCPTAGSARRRCPTPRPARTTPTGTARTRP